MYLTNVKRAAIARALDLDRETVVRILSQQETETLVQGHRDAVLKIVPNALIGASELVKTRGRHGENTAEHSKTKAGTPGETSADISRYQQPRASAERSASHRTRSVGRPLITEVKSQPKSAKGKRPPKDAK